MALNGINTELERLRKAKQDLRTSIQNQGVPIADGASISEYSQAVDGISTVRSVAGKKPDTAGDVSITVADLGGISNIKVGSTTTGKAGSLAQVTVQKQDDIATLDFVIPTGKDGEVVQQTYFGQTEPTDNSIVVWIDTSGEADTPTGGGGGIATLTFTGIVNKTYNGGKAVTVNIPNNLSAYTNDAQFQTAEQVTSAINVAIGNALRREY